MFHAHGYPCFAQRNTELGIWCGYVGIGRDHPLYEADSEQIDDMIDMHGGCTYAGQGLPRGGFDEHWWMGFDCGHYMDDIPGLPEVSAVFVGTYRDIEFVRGQCTAIAAQLKALVPSA